ncbi:MAG: hypothetical protein ACJ74Z_13170 [Bryobacteraceae bacterium]
MSCASPRNRFRVARFLISLISLLSFGLPNARATSIVILRTANRVYIGADSRRSYRESGESYTGSVCKIVPAGRLLFVASGLTYANDEQVASVAAKIGRVSPTVRYAIEEFRRRMQQFLPQALAAEARIDRNRVRKGLILEAAFIGMERNLVSVSVEWYRSSGNLSKPRVTTDRRTYASAAVGRYDFIFLGKRRAIDRYLRGRSWPIRNDADAISLITRLINLEISESPESTARPIDILELDRTGSHWLQRKASCEVSSPAGG